MTNPGKPNRTTLIQTIKRHFDIMEILPGPLSRCSSQNGGEYCGPCPFCSADKRDDRFHVQPDNPTGGRWFCRQCTGDITGGQGKWYDALDYVQRWRKTDFNGALAYLQELTGIDQPDKTDHIPASRNHLKPQRTSARADASTDSELAKWQAYQQTQLQSAHDSLLYGLSQKAKSVQRYVQGRCIKTMMQAKYQLGAGWYPYSQGTRPGQPVFQNALVIPWFAVDHAADHAVDPITDPKTNQPALTAMTHRFIAAKPDPHDPTNILDQRYGAIGGSKRILFGEEHHNPNAQTLVLVEGELNAISVDQAMCDIEGKTTNINVLSWGSESNIHNTQTQEKIIANVQRHAYQRILVWADQTRYAAVFPCLLTKHLTDHHFRKIAIVNPQLDANDMLVQDPTGIKLADFIIQSVY